MRWGSPKAIAPTDCESPMLRWLIIVVLVLVLFNGLRHWLEKIGLGRLPGDFHVQRGNWSFYFPLTTSILVSVLLTLLFTFLSRR